MVARKKTKRRSSWFTSGSQQSKKKMEDEKAESIIKKEDEACCILDNGDMKMEGAGQPRDSCPCSAPDPLFTFPQDESERKKWMQKVRLHDELYNTRLRVCSVHFRDGKPTDENPYPELKLEFDVNSHSDLLANGSQTREYNRHHQKALQLFCRLCGDNDGVVTKACRAYPKLKFQLDIFNSMAIDVTQDSSFIHPRSICYVCRAKLSAWKSAMQKGKPIDIQIQPPTFMPHDESSRCQVCLNQSLRNGSPLKMPSLDKPLAMEGSKSKDEEDKLYVFDFKLDMDDLISSTLKDLCEPEHEDTMAFQADLSKFSQQLRSIDRKTKEVRKIYTECSEKLRIYREELEEADREEELREAAAEIDAKEAAEANAKVDEESDEDDVQFVATTYDPSVMEKRQVLASQNKNLVSVLSSSPKMEPLTLPPGAVLVKLPPNSQAQGGTSPSLQSLRNALVATINKQIPAQLQPTTTAAMPSVSRFVQSNSLQNQQRMETLYREDVETIEIGGKILGKKFNDIWYRGTVSDIQSKDKPIEERKYSIKFDGKGKKVLTPKHVAFKDPIVRQIYVGTRVIALYRDEDSTSSYYAGIVAETPNGRNQQRYLVFFDDGYAQYSLAMDINKVLWQSANVWEDIHPDSQEFIKEYLKQYPERPMVRLQKGQMVKTEWNGKWWTAKVMEVDASLVKMFFLADKRVEWIYRGSTRLEPLYTALANAEYNKSAGKMKRHTNTTVGKTPVVEYTRGISEPISQQPAVVAPVPQANKTPSPQVPATLVRQTSADKKRPVARKSTSGRPSTDQWEGPWVKQTRPGGPVEIQKSKEFVASSISSQKVGKDMASVLQDRLSKTTDNTDLDDDSLGQRMESKLPFKDRVRKKFRTHNCGKDCMKDCEDDPSKYKGGNPLLIPLLCGWERHVCKMKPNHKRVVMYRTPCARRLRSMEDVFTFLMLCDSHLTIDMFCFDPTLHVHTEFVPVKTFCDIKDLSYGKENVPISCVNAHDRQYPDYVEYSNVRIPAKGVKLNLDPDFLVCCSCTDGCSDRAKCECQQLTVEATAIVEGGKKNPNAGYEHRRLKEPLTTGVYECNSRCKCDSRCYNRAAQNGLNVRLQVFKTEKKGWGLRCLDDLPSGGFICIYAGQLLTEQGANEDGQQYGDEYLAELDYMEVVERQKEGYESDADIDEGVGGDSDDDDEDSDRHFSDSDSDFSANGPGEKVSSTDLMDMANTHRTRTSTRLEKNSKDDKEDKKSIGKIVLRRDSSRSGSKDDEWYASGDLKKQNQQKNKDNGSRSVRFQENPEKNAATAAWVNKVDNGNPITIDDEEDMDTGESKLNMKKSASVDSFGMDSDSLPDLDTDTAPKEGSKKPKEAPPEKKEEPKAPVEFPDPRRTCLTARRSTSKTSRFKNLPDPKKKLPTDDNKVEEIEEDEENKDEKPGTRYYFHDGQECYIMDAKSMGNIGRYLNHSCTPNVFVQNVFVDTHDLRFPWVTFFAGQYIRAGTELTWDYNYEVGSVPGKILYCYCGSAECRGRLL